MMSYSMYIRLIGFFALLAIVLLRADIAQMLKNQGIDVSSLYIIPPAGEK